MINITWNRNWINSFESGWSILEKIKYANVITTRDLLSEFGTPSAKRLRSSIIGRQHRGLVELEGFNHEHLTNSLGINILHHTRYCLNKMIGMFSNNADASSLLRNEFTYCEKCLSMGYHSLLHQFCLLNQCPFHLCELSSTCSNCGKSLNFELLNQTRAGGFICNCTKKIIDYTFSSFTEWQFTQPIKNQLLLKWLDMDLSASGKLTSTYLYLPALVNKPHAMKFLLEFHETSLH